MRWFRRRIGLVTQMTASECPVACLAMVLEHHGRPAPRQRLRAALGTGRDGASAHDLVAAARSFGLVGRGLRPGPGQAHRLAPGSVLHWDAKHFVVLERATPKWFWILDPAQGRRRLDPEAFARGFSGIALEFSVDPTFAAAANDAAPEASPARRSLVAATLRPGFLVPTLLASLGSAALGVAGALVMAQIVARLSAPRPDFLDLAALIAAIVVATVGARAWRERCLHAFGAAVERELGRGLVDQLLRLPLAFFRHRTAADMGGRVASVHGLSQRLVGGVGTLLTEGPMALAYLVVLWQWSPTMALASVAIVSAHAAVSSGLRRHRERHARAALRHEAEARAFEAQLLAQIAAVKATGCEAAVAARWAQLHADAARTADRHGRASAIDSSGLEGFAALIPMVLLAVGAHEVATGALTLPAMIGTNCLAVALFRPVDALIGAVGSLAAVRATLERIDDVLLEPVPARAPEVGALELPGVIELQDLTVAGEGAPTLAAVSFKLAPVGHVAIIGGAGAGKSALAAVLAGVSRPDAGRVLVSGRDPAHAADACLVLPQVALFDGDLRANIALGAADPEDEAAIVAAARLADVHAEISALPLGYRTAVYDGGKALPVGLRLRIGLARALARRPRLLIVDEAADALGAAAEGHLVDAALAGPVRTVVTVTRHRSTIERADRVIVLERGRLVDVGTPAALRARCPRYRELTDGAGPSLAMATGT